MFRNYFKIGLRNLLRNKFHTAINILGMVVGLTIGIAILLTVYGQLSYDRFHANEHQLFQAYQVFNTKQAQEISNNFGFPAAPVYKAENTAIARSSGFLFGGSDAVYNNKEIDVPVTLVDEDFLSMFTFPVLTGNKANPLHNLTDLVITERMAKKTFGSEEAIGKTINVTMGSKLLSLTVSAVLKDVPTNSSIRFEALARIENRSDYARDKNNWNNQHHPVYVQLKEGFTQQQAEQEMKKIDKGYLADWFTSLLKDGAKPDKRGDVMATRLLPIDEVHFSPRIGSGAIKEAEIYTVLGVGLLIILIACFNFININLANAFTRTKEIGVRKCLGAANTKLFGQLWSESFLVCLVAFLFSLVLVNVAIQVINNSSEVNMPLLTMMWQPQFLLMAVGLLLFVSLVAGGYPSWVMTRFKIVETLKGKVSLKRKGGLRNSLIVLQFVIACIMISCTFIVYQQFKHLQMADLGFNKDYIISVPLHNQAKARESIEKLRTRLSANPNIISMTGSSVNLGKGRDNSSSKISMGVDYKGKPINTNIANVDYNFLETIGLKAIDGNDFKLGYHNDSLRNVIVSASVAKQFNERQLVGQAILVDSSEPRWNIVGIFPDFHLYSMNEELEPLTLIMDKKANLGYCFIKVNSQNMLASMEAIKKEMALLEPGRIFKGSFVDENIRNWYEQERTLSILFSIAAAVAIVLSCMGLLAMVILIIQQRIKEIGIRKVLGASTKNISLLISKQFLALVLIAVLIATPISWLAMNKWLQGFAYRIEIQWWMFALVAATALFIAMITISFNTIRAAMQNPVQSLKTD